MKKLLFVSIMLLALLLTACSDGGSENPPVGASTGIADRGGVIATLNGQNIYEAEYNYYFGLYLQNNYEQMSGYFYLLGYDLDTEEGLADFLGNIEYMSWSMLLDSEVIRQIAASYDLSFEHEALADVMPWGQYQSLSSNSLYSQLFYALEEEMLSELEISEDQARAIYEAEPARYDSVLTSHILFRFDDSLQDEAEIEANKQATYQRALEVLALLDGGADFAETAIEYSDDGSASQGGVISYYINSYGDDVNGATSFFPEYVEAAWTLSSVGEYTAAPVESTAGYHIIIIDDIRSGFEDSYETIANSMRTVSEDDVQTRLWEVIDTYRETATIERNQDYLYYVEEAEEETQAEDDLQPSGEIEFNDLSEED